MCLDSMFHVELLYATYKSVLQRAYYTRLRKELGIDVSILLAIWQRLQPMPSSSPDEPTEVSGSITDPGATHLMITPDTEPLPRPTTPKRPGGPCG